MEDATASSGDVRRRRFLRRCETPPPTPLAVEDATAAAAAAAAAAGLPNLLYSSAHKTPWRRTSRSPSPPPTPSPPPPPPPPLPPAPASAAAPAAAACVAGVLVRLRIIEKFIFFVVQQAAHVGAFIFVSASFGYNVYYAFKEYQKLDPFEGTYRVYIACLSLFLMLLEIGSSKLSLIWTLLVETRGGRGLLYIFVAITMRKLRMCGDEYFISDTIFLFGISSVVVGMIRLWRAASQENIPDVTAV